MYNLCYQKNHFESGDLRDTKPRLPRHLGKLCPAFVIAAAALSQNKIETVNGSQSDFEITS